MPSIKMMVLVSITLGCAGVAMPAFAQSHAPVTKNLAQLPQSDVTLVERVNQLESMVKTLQARLADDEAKLKKAGDAANQANLGVGLVNSGLGKQVENIKAEEAQVEQKQAQAGQKLDALTARFNSHNHRYNTLELILHPDNSIKTLTYKVGNTMGPNN